MKSLNSQIGAVLCRESPRDEWGMEKIYRRFQSIDGRSVTFRAPSMDDLDDFLGFINSLVDEGAEVPVEDRRSREAEADWLGRLLADLEKGSAICIVGEVGGKLIANSEIRKATGRRSHVGGMAIAIKDGFRDVGIGTELIRLLIEESRRAGLRLLCASVFETNLRARHVCEKVGFREVGRMPKAIRKGDLCVDEVVMALEL